MLRRGFAVFAVAVLAAGLWGESAVRFVTCYFITEEGASPEGNALAQRFMGLEPELLRSFAPLRFELRNGAYSFSSAGEFGYSAEGVVPVERYGNVVLNSVRAEIRAPAPPKAAKSRSVTLKVADLAARRGALQPAYAAVEQAARALKLKKGSAWIIRMELAAPGLLRAEVGFGK